MFPISTLEKAHLSCFSSKFLRDGVFSHIFFKFDYFLNDCTIAQIIIFYIKPNMKKCNQNLRNPLSPMRSSRGLLPARGMFL